MFRLFPAKVLNDIHDCTFIREKNNRLLCRYRILNAYPIGLTSLSSKLDLGAVSRHESESDSCRYVGEVVDLWVNSCDEILSAEHGLFEISLFEENRRAGDLPCEFPRGALLAKEVSA